MIKDLTIFALAHLGAFVVIRDLLETSGIRAIEDANGVTEEAETNFAQKEGEYILPSESCSYSEVLNYALFGKALVLYVYESARSGKMGEKLKSAVATASEQVTNQMSDFYPVLNEKGEQVILTGDSVIITDEVTEEGNPVVFLD